MPIDCPLSYAAKLYIMGFTNSLKFFFILYKRKANFSFKGEAF